MNRIAVCGTLFVGLTAVVQPQSADGTVRAVGLEELTRSADRIVIAEVVGSETFSETYPVKRDARTGRQYYYTAPYTYHTLQVSEELKRPSPTDRALLRTLGGRHAGGILVTVDLSAPRLSSGERVVLFLRDAPPSPHYPSEIFEVVGGRYGKLVIAAEGALSIVRPETSNPLLDEDLGTQGLPLAAVIQRVRAVVEAQASEGGRR